MPDKTAPALLIQRWGPWVQDCVSLLDGDGTFHHWKYAGAYADQPWIDLQIYQMIRKRWVELRNDEMNSRYKNIPSLNNHGAGRKGARRSGTRRRR